MPFSRRSMILSFGLSLLFFSCAQAPVRSTVDAYGEAPLDANAPLCFVRESIPLQERPIVDACREAARNRGLSIAEPGTSGCRPIVISTRISGSTKEFTTSPRFSTSLGLYRGWGWGYGGGLGIDTGTTEVKEFADRQIHIVLFKDPSLKEPLRSIDVRSAGSESSVPAVAYEMCEAAFRDFPKNLRGETYETKRREYPSEAAP